MVVRKIVKKFGLLRDRWKQDWYAHHSGFWKRKFNILVSDKRWSQTWLYREKRLFLRKELTPPVMVSMSPWRALPTRTATPRTLFFNGWVISDTRCRVPGIPFRFVLTSSPSKNDPNRLTSASVHFWSQISTTYYFHLGEFVKSWSNELQKLKEPRISAILYTYTLATRTKLTSFGFSTIILVGNNAWRNLTPLEINFIQVD